MDSSTKTSLVILCFVVFLIPVFADVALANKVEPNELQEQQNELKYIKQYFEEKIRSGQISNEKVEGYLTNLVKKIESGEVQTAEDLNDIDRLYVTIFFTEEKVKKLDSTTKCNFDCMKKRQAAVA